MREVVGWHTIRLEQHGILIVDREIEVAFQWLTQSDNANWRVVMTPAMLNLQFEKALLYPAGYASTGIMFAPTVRLPEGWQYGVALETTSFENGLATFQPRGRPIRRKRKLSYDIFVAKF